MGKIVRLASMLLVCSLVESFASGENRGTAVAPPALQDYIVLYVCGVDSLVKFDAETGGHVAGLPVGTLLVDVDVGLDDFIYVTEEAVGQVHRVDPETGQADEGPFGETGRIGAPRGIAVGPNGHMYVADVPLPAPSDVLEFDENGTYVQHLLDDPDNRLLFTVEDVACDGSGNIFVTQWETWDEITCVLKYTGSRWEVFGQTDNLISPWGICFGPDGDMYVVDDDPIHFGVFRYDGQSGASKGVFGATGTNSNLIAPRYCTFGPDGDLYVSEDDNSSVKVFSGPLKPGAGAYKGIFGATEGKVPEALGLVFGPGGTPPVKPELSIEKLEDGTMRVTLTGAEGKSYELRYNPDPTVSEFTEWTFGATINLEDTTMGAWEDATAPGDSRRFYKAKEL